VELKIGGRGLRGMGVWKYRPQSDLGSEGHKVWRKPRGDRCFWEEAVSWFDISGCSAHFLLPFLTPISALASLLPVTLPEFLVYCEGSVYSGLPHPKG
jgi:hypothetical protein